MFFFSTEMKHSGFVADFSKITEGKKKRKANNTEWVEQPETNKIKRLAKAAELIEQPVEKRTKHQ